MKIHEKERYSSLHGISFSFIFFLQHLKIDNIQYYLQSVFWLITTWYEIANITVLNKMLEANMQN